MKSREPRRRNSTDLTDLPAHLDRLPDNGKQMENNFKTLSQEDNDAILKAGEAKLPPSDAAQPDEFMVESLPSEPFPKVIDLTGARLVEKLASEASVPIPPESIPPSVTEQPSPVNAASEAEIVSANQRIDQLENSLADTNTAIEQFRREFQEVTQQLQLLNKSVAEIAKGLKNTPAYNVKETFPCDTCHSKGNIATPIKCTECEKINWWGWWPKKSKD